MKKKILIMLCAAAIAAQSVSASVYAAGSDIAVSAYSLVNLAENAEGDHIADIVKVVDLGWSQQLVVRLSQGAYNDYRFSVDNTEINVSPVDDNGTIVKWEISSLDHRTLEITEKKTGKTQSVLLNPNAKTTGRVRTSAGDGADYFLAHGSVYTWDYCLTNYDDEGNAIVKPAKTTFDINENGGDEIPYYSPDAQIYSDDSAKYGVSGEAEVMFNYNDEQSRAWFDNITDTDLVSFDDSHRTLNSNLQYTKQTNIAHGDNTVAKISVPIGQNNFYANGRYYLRITSGGKSRLFPIHLVAQTAPVFKLNESGAVRSGQNVHFKVENMTYGVTMPVYRVDLTTPDNNNISLEKFEDWYLIGDTFVFYNDTNNHTAQPGIYTLTVYSDGFKTVSKSFTVGSAGLTEKTAKTSSSVKASAYSLDAVSSATVSGGAVSESGGEGGSNTVSANLLFDADLLTNALILDDLGLGCQYSDAVAKRWYEDMSGYDSVFKAESKDYYSFTDYRDAVEEARLKGEYLSFGDYINSGSAQKTLNRPYSVKSVLENNLLGEVQMNGSYNQKKASDIALVNDKGEGISEINYGENLNLAFSDTEFLSEAASGKFNINGNSLSVSKDKISVNENMLTLNGDVFKPGENTVIIQTENYQDVKFAFNCQAQSDDENTDKNNSTAVNAKIKSVEKYFGVDCRITFENSEDWTGKINAVKVNGADYEKADSSYGVWSNSKFYVRDNEILIGEGEFNLDSDDNNNIIIISAEGYDDLILEIKSKRDSAEIHKHTYAEKIVKEPSCCETGEKVYACICGDEKDTEEIPALGHTPAEWKTLEAPTCTENGKEESVCSVCNESLTREIPATGHNFSDEFTEDSPAGCEVSGSESRHCLNDGCDEKADVTEIPALGHTVKDNDFKMTVKASCTQKGIEKAACEICGKELSREIPTDPEKHSYKITTVKPTYFSEGYTLKKCACGATEKTAQKPKLKLGQISGLKTVMTSENSVKLSWNKVKDAGGYIVYRYDASKKKWLEIKRTAANSFTAGGLKAGTGYTFAVKAYKVSGKQTALGVSSKITAVTVPAKPTLKISSGKNKAVLSWSKVSSAAGYKVYFKTSKNGKYKLIKTTSLTKFTKLKLTSKKTYYFAVKSYKTVGKTTKYSKTSYKTVKVK